MATVGRKSFAARPLRRLSRCAGLVSAIVLAAATALPLEAAGPLWPDPDPYDATSSRAARQSAVEAIPYAKLDPEAQANVKAVLGDVTFFRRLPIRALKCDPDFYLFLVENPDVVVGIWQIFGIGSVSLQRTGPDTYRFQDGEGSAGTIQYVHSSPDTHVVYGEGTYSGPLLARPVVGKTVLILKTGYVLEPDGRYYVTARLDTFLQVEPSAVEVLTKTFQPLVGRVADVNFIQTTAFVESLSRTAEVNRSGMQRLAGRLSKVQPEVRQQFAQLSGQVAQKAARLNQPLPMGKSAMASRPQETPVR